MTVIERFYKSDIQKIIPMKNWRSIRAWCKKNGVGILSDAGLNIPYVLKVEFEARADKEPKKYLKEKYGNENFSEIDFNSNVSSKNILQTTKKTYEYKPIGQHEKDCLTRLHKIINELPSCNNGKPVAYSKI